VHGESCSPIRSFFVVSFASTTRSRLLLRFLAPPSVYSGFSALNSPPNDRVEHRPTPETRHLDPHARTIVAIVKDLADLSFFLPPSLNSARIEERMQRRRQHVLHGQARVSLTGSLLTFRQREVSLANARVADSLRFNEIAQRIASDRNAPRRTRTRTRSRGISGKWQIPGAPRVLTARSCEHAEQSRGYSTTSSDLPVVARSHAHER